MIFLGGHLRFVFERDAKLTYALLNLVRFGGFLEKVAERSVRGRKESSQ